MTDSDRTRELTIADMTFPDELERRIRERAIETDSGRERENAEFSRELRASFGEVRNIAWRRTLQFFGLLRDIVLALLGRGGAALGAVRENSQQHARYTREIAEDYRLRLWRRLQGRVLVYRLEKKPSGYFDRTAIFIDRVDLRSNLMGNGITPAALVIGRFDKVTAYWQGRIIGRSEGVNVKLIRRSGGNLFALQATDASLPPMPASEVLNLLARHNGSRLFEATMILPALLRQGLNAEAAIGALNETATKYRRLVLIHMKLRGHLGS